MGSSSTLFWHFYSIDFPATTKLQAPISFLLLPEEYSVVWLSVRPPPALTYVFFIAVFLRLRLYDNINLLFVKSTFVNNKNILVSYFSFYLWSNIQYYVLCIFRVNMMNWYTKSYKIYAIHKSFKSLRKSNIYHCNLKVLQTYCIVGIKTWWSGKTN